MKIDLKKLQFSLTPEQIINLVQALGADRYIEKSDLIIFPTICHNEDVSDASMKLYYYKNDYRFHCYTECSDTFNIYELINRVFSLKQSEVSFSQILEWLTNQLSLDGDGYILEEDKYISHRQKYIKKIRTTDIPHYSPELINIFTKIYPTEWIQEGISEKSMDKFNIRYSINQNKIIIPHYDIDGNLIGIRGRALNQFDIDNFGKYMPVKIEDKLYAHPLSQNLYGLNFSKDYIKEKRIAYLFEGEKSALLYDTYYPQNLSSAVCGSNFNKVQLDLLLKNCHPYEIVICFDKEYDTAGGRDGDLYFNKLMNIAKKYSQYVNISFVFDRDNLLDKKDSPIDKGKEIFEQLVKNRVKTWQVL